MVFDPDDYYPSEEDKKEAERNGIPREYVVKRIRALCWSKKEAVTRPVGKYTDRSKFAAIAKENGIDYKMFIQRIHHGWSEQLASTTPKRDRNWMTEQIKRYAELRRKYPRIALDLAEMYGISNQLFRRRMRSGWDIYRASTLPPSPQNAALILREKYGDKYFKT